MSRRVRVGPLACSGLVLASALLLGGCTSFFGGTEAARADPPYVRDDPKPKSGAACGTHPSGTEEGGRGAGCPAAQK